MLRLTARAQILQAQGKYQNQPPRPFVLGSEFAGKIAQDSPIPEGCPFRPGDRVFGGGQGAYGEMVPAQWQSLVALPDNMSYDQGAGTLVHWNAAWDTDVDGAWGTGLYVTWPTSYEALVGRAELKPGEYKPCVELFETGTTLMCGIGEWVLVTASAGGVGIAAVQLAKGMAHVRPLEHP